MRFSLFFLLVVWSSNLWGILTCLNISAHIRSWQCLNDYVFTIRCELNMTSETRPHDALYWLEFYDEWETFECVLTSQTDPWVCVMDLSAQANEIFTDTKFFQISFNYSLHGKNNSFVLTNDYSPVEFIQPVPPSNLTLLWKPDEAVFHWVSGYEDQVMLVPALWYQLHIQRKGIYVKVLKVETTFTNMSVPVSKFVAYTDYTARVRSRPNQNHYKGVWSHWGPTISWTTGPIKETVYSTAVWMALFVLPVILLLYFSYTRCKRCVLNPSPAPHIGDFKCSAILPEKVGDLLQREESLQIDNLIEEPNPAQLEKTNDVSDGSNHTSFTGSPSMLQSSMDSKVSMDSWMQAWLSAEKGSVTYSDEYCMLSQTISE